MGALVQYGLKSQTLYMIVQEVKFSEKISRLKFSKLFISKLYSLLQKCVGTFPSQN